MGQINLGNASVSTTWRKMVEASRSIISFLCGSGGQPYHGAHRWGLADAGSTAFGLPAMLCKMGVAEIVEVVFIDCVRIAAERTIGRAHV